MAEEQEPLTNATRCRNWVFTLNNFVDSLTITHEVFFEGLLNDQSNDMSYVVYQHEVGQQGTDHLQGYMEFSKQQRFSAIKRLMPSAHWEKRRGTQKQAEDYCSKEESRVAGPWRFGQAKAQGTRTDIEGAKRILDTGGTLRDCADADFLTFCKYHKAFDRYKTDITAVRSWEMDVKVYWGDAGTGKTRKAHEDNPGAYFKPTGDWWDGYNGEECVILDDFYGQMQWGFLLKLLDRYPLRVPFKGGFHQFTSKRIIFTSNVDITDWYKYAENPRFKIEALRRRISEKVHFAADL